jgi:hypothetical protein
MNVAVSHSCSSLIENFSSTLGLTTCSLVSSKEHDHNTTQRKQIKMFATVSFATIKACKSFKATHKLLIVELK